MIANTVFKFDNQAASISTCSRQMLAHLEPLLAPYGQARALMLRAKFIIAEFLNNAVKHSGTHETTFNIQLEERSLTISKEDDGAAFNLITELEKQDEQLVVSSDAMHLLYAVKKDELTVSFYCKENFTFELDVNKLAEHLGLLIITKAADEFTYRYNDTLNKFTVKLNLG